MPPKTTDTVVSTENAENSGTLETKAKADVVTEESQTLNYPDQFDVAEKEEEPLDMSVESLMQLLEDFFNAVDVQDAHIQARLESAENTLAEALYAQNRINRIVTEKTKELDELIIEQAGSPDNNPMNEIQFYLTAQQRKREQKAEQRNREIAQGIDAAELIKRLDGRAPVDQRQPAKRKNPAALKAVKPANAA